MVASIMFLEDNAELREVLSEVTKSELGEEALSYSRLEDLKNHRDEVLQTKIAIIDINLGSEEPTGVEAFRWLKSQGYSGKICFLTGHVGAHPMVQEASEVGVEIWSKPMFASKLCEAIRSVIKK